MTDTTPRPQPTSAEVREWAEEQVRTLRAKRQPMYGEVGPLYLTLRDRGRIDLAIELVAFIDGAAETEGRK